MRRFAALSSLGMAASLSAQRAQLLDKLKAIPAGASMITVLLQHHCQASPELLRCLVRYSKS